jgi:hypothetical protein
VNVSAVSAAVVQARAMVFKDRRLVACGTAVACAAVYCLLKQDGRDHSCPGSAFQHLTLGKWKVILSILFFFL